MCLRLVLAPARCLSIVTNRDPRGAVLSGQWCRRRGSPTFRHLNTRCSWSFLGEVARGWLPLGGDFPCMSSPNSHRPSQEPDLPRQGRHRRTERTVTLVSELASCTEPARRDLIHRNLVELNMPVAVAVASRYRDHGWMVRPPRRIQELQIQVSRAQTDLVLQTGHPPPQRRSPSSWMRTFTTSRRP